MRGDHPLVIFIDDLQWADTSSLKLLLFLLSDATHKHLLFIGAYRDNEVDQRHPLLEVIENIKKEGSIVSRLELKPLNLESVQVWIADTFHSSKEQLDAITAQVYQKTQGNPFFVFQFLKLLYQEKLINFDVEKQNWSANLPLIQQLQVSDNVANFMVGRIQKLPQMTLELMKIAAAIGHTFDLRILAKLQGLTLIEAANILWPAVQEELILHQSAGYIFEMKILSLEEEGKPHFFVFQHDRVQHAAYQLVEEQELNFLHYRIGKILLDMIEESKRSENIIVIVNQLNYGVHLIKDEAEKIALAQLNLIAGEKAKDSVAYGAAIQYLSTGVNLLPQDCWKKHYALTLGLYENLAASELCIGNQQQASEHFDAIIQHGRSLLEINRTQMLKVSYYCQTGRLQEGLTYGFELLKQVGLHLPLKPTLWQKRLALLKLYIHPYLYSSDYVNNLKKCTDPQALFITDIFQAILYPAYYVGTEFFMVLSADFMGICIKYGQSECYAEAYCCMALCSTMEKIQNYQAAYQFGRIAKMHMAKYPNSIASNLSKCVYYSFTFYWNEHMRQGPIQLKQAERDCFEVGLVSYAGGATAQSSNLLLLAGEPLDYVQDEIRKNQQQAIKYKTAAAVAVTTLALEVCLAFQGLTNDPTDPIPKDFETLFKAFPEKKDLKGIDLLLYFNYYIWRTCLLYHHERYAESVAIAEKITLILDYVPSNCLWLIYYFYKALALAAHYYR